MLIMASETGMAILMHVHPQLGGMLKYWYCSDVESYTKLNC